MYEIKLPGNPMRIKQRIIDDKVPNSTVDIDLDCLNVITSMIINGTIQGNKRENQRRRSIYDLLKVMFTYKFITKETDIIDVFKAMNRIIENRQIFGWYCPDTKKPVFWIRTDFGRPIYPRWKKIHKVLRADIPSLNYNNTIITTYRGEIIYEPSEPTEEIRD